MFLLSGMAEIKARSSKEDRGQFAPLLARKEILGKAPIQWQNRMGFFNYSILIVEAEDL